METVLKKKTTKEELNKLFHTIGTQKKGFDAKKYAGKVETKEAAAEVKK